MVGPSAGIGPSGSSRLGCVVALLLVGGVGYVAVPFVRAELEFRSAEDRLRAEIRQLSIERSAEAADELVPVIRTLGLPRAAERIAVSPVPGSSRRFLVRVTYADTLPILTWRRVIPRRIEAETS